MLNIFDFLYFSKVQKVSLTCLLGFLATSIVVGCSENDKTAGGGPSGTEAGNAITAQIMTQNGPAAYALVSLSDCESLDSSQNITKADSNGFIIIQNVSDGIYTLEAKHSGKALQNEVFVNGKDVSLGIKNLDITGSIFGTINKNASGIVKVRGMNHSANVIDGKFNIDSLPAGPLSLVFIPKENINDTSSTYLKVVAGEKSISSTFANESKSLLLDDFQDSNYQNRFVPAHTYDGGWWYFSYSKLNVTPSFITNEKEPRFVLEKDENGNIAAHVKAEFGEAVIDSIGNTIWPWATVGIELGKSDKALCNDISSVDSVAFLTKGNGAVVFAAVDETQKNDHQKIAQFEFNLSDNWTRISIPLADILDPQYSYTCVNQLIWNFKSTNEANTIEFWLDDVELIGGNRLSIWKR